ncbi:nucleotidyltransferase [uncultured Parasutterella sp.]|uniref:nucleotidyltransferase domain-containing protein n=1 Tax=uncultured Parasutterella sp. TaxID=1263098 RepID=UPI0025B6A08E|nr:nucleotidyltransferase [uncultured Parasutterella sp.]
MTMILSGTEVKKYKDLVNRSFNILEANQALFDNVRGEDQLLNLFNRVLEHIAIDDRDIKEAEKKYQEIANHLQNLLRPISPEIKTQGSARIKTIIAGIGNSNFDIDSFSRSACIKGLEEKPLEFFDKYSDALRIKYPTAENKNRCIKIPMKDFPFYIELTPIVELDNGLLYVVDRETESWKRSDPDKYADWFEACCNSSKFRHALTDSVDPIPDQHIDKADILRKAVRLLKRHRDYYYYKNRNLDPADKPISCIITTLAAMAYVGLQETYLYRGQLTEVERLLSVIRIMPKLIEKSGPLWVVPNPTIDGENFAEKWNTHSERKEAFFNWIDQLEKDIVKIITSANDEIILKCSVAEAFGPFGADQNNNKPHFDAPYIPSPSQTPGLA